MITSAIIHFDGGARPNPGPSAIGYIVETDHWTEERNEYIGESTNNRTEYQALIQGLELPLKEGCTNVAAKRGSELIVKQVRGEYDVKKQGHRSLYNCVPELAEKFDQFEVEYVLREENMGRRGVSE